MGYSPQGRKELDKTERLHSLLILCKQKCQLHREQSTVGNHPHAHGHRGKLASWPPLRNTNVAPGGATRTQSVSDRDKGTTEPGEAPAVSWPGEGGGQNKKNTGPDLGPEGSEAGGR